MNKDQDQDDIDISHVIHNPDFVLALYKRYKHYKQLYYDILNECDEKTNRIYNIQVALRKYQSFYVKYYTSNELSRKETMFMQDIHDLVDEVVDDYDSDSDIVEDPPYSIAHVISTKNFPPLPESSDSDFSCDSSDSTKN